MGIFDTLLGRDSADAAKAAAADQYAKQQAAAQATRDAGNQYQGSLYNLSQRFEPYAQGGNASLAMLMNGLGLNGPGGSESFTNAYRALPGYQSGMDAGSRAVASRLNAGPGIQSGAAMKALQRYGSDYEDQRSGDYLSRLLGLSQQGFGATQAGVNTASQGYQGQLQGNLGGAGQLYNSAGTIGQGDIAAAQAKSAGLTNTIGLGLNALGMFAGAGGFSGLGSSFKPAQVSDPTFGGFSRPGNNAWSVRA